MALPTGRLNKKLGLRIKLLRAKRDITQEELAELVGVDRSYIGFVERGKKNPTLDKLGKIAKALKVGVDELFKN